MVTNETPDVRPPGISAALLGWLLKDDFSTPSGDYEEYFKDLVESEGLARARWWYRGQVLRLLPNRLFEKMYWGKAMLKNYFTLGLRNLKKNKIVSLVNVLGLSGAVACTIAIYLFLNVLTGSDDFHERADDLYLIGHTVEQFERSEKWGTTPIPLGSAIEGALPQVESVVRIATRSAAVRATGIDFRETISFADPGFFEMFTFPIARGVGTLDDPAMVIISANTAEKYFREKDPIGETFTVNFDNGWETLLEVGGVAEPFPGTPSFQFDFLLPFQSLSNAAALNLEDWSLFVNATFLHIPEKDDVPFVEAQLERFIAPQNDAHDSWDIDSYFLDSVGKPAWSAWEITNRAVRAPEPWGMAMMGAIALMTLLVASFNYINISLGFVGRRLKEIGVRKTAGAEKRQLIFQLLTENIVLCAIALLIGTLVAWLAIIPLFNDLFVEDIPLDFAGNASFWFFLVGLLLFLGLLSGAYPAFYIASFQPVAILRGTPAHHKKKRLTHMLLTAQFALSLIPICICTYFFSLSGFIESQEWGYDGRDTIVAPIYNHEQFLVSKNASLQLPHVLDVAGAQEHVGASRARVAIQIEGEEKEVIRYRVGSAYLNTLSIEVGEGQPFVGTVEGREAVVNRSFADSQGWSSAVGEGFRYENAAYTVVGVIDDFLVDPFMGQELPAFFALADEDAFRYLVIRAEAGKAEQVAEALGRIWDEAFPEIPYTSFVQTEVFDPFYESIRKLTRTIGYLAVFSLLISCMGLFGMATQKATQHLKEIGVRKVLGATASNVVYLVNRSFLLILIVAALIATPLCYMGFYTLLNFAPVDLPLGPGPFLLANIIVFGTAAMALVMQVRQLLRYSPAEILRHQ